MGLLRKIVGFLGFNKDDDTGELHNDDQDDGASVPFAAASHQYGPRKGFSVPVQVAVDRPATVPLLVPCVSGDGGVQGFRWFGKKLRIDEDGDIADEFLDEILPEKSFNVDEQQEHLPLSRFEVKYSTKPVKIKNFLRSADGKIQVEYQGRLEWI